MATGRVLLVDDEESVLTTMQAILELDGYEVTTTPRGADAVKLLRTGEAFDVVMTDLRLDDVDGMTILSEVRRRSPDTITIMLTGYASLDSAVKALREGAYDYLTKPCDVEELKLTVARGIERRRLGQQLRSRVAELEVANATIGRLNSELQRRVDEATAELRQLYTKAQKHVEELEELDRLKSQFLSMASHELKTPLTSMSGFLQITLRRMRRRLEGEPVAQPDWEREQRSILEQLEVVNRQTNRLTRLVNELLDVSRIETGRLPFHPQPVDVGELVSDAVERMQLTTARHQLTVECVGPESPIISADRDYFEQVINNLIGNAIKYSPDGGPIRIRVESDAEDVHLMVVDRGVGVPASELEAIFGLFYRSDERQARDAGGMGLGLYISKEIVSRMDGRIWAESTAGQGSTFHVVLPRVAQPQPAATAS